MRSVKCESRSRHGGGVGLVEVMARRAPGVLMRNNLMAASTLLDHIAAPILAEFHIHGTFLKLSLLKFLKRSPNILDLKLPYLRDD